MTLSGYFKSYFLIRLALIPVSKVVRLNITLRNKSNYFLALKLKVTNINFCFQRFIFIHDDNFEFEIKIRSIIKKLQLVMHKMKLLKNNSI